MAEGEQIPLLRARAMMIACTAVKAAPSSVPLSLSSWAIECQWRVRLCAQALAVPANQLTAANDGKRANLRLQVCTRR